ncbi:MAG: hypothetical protein KKA07_16175 [Bacteroidetes bacterium]|nr:hypothetical protein [Bacteroidota bacterium]MBU1720602.1 hypothetical protein [Bacteroidota bacterium]
MKNRNETFDEHLIRAMDGLRMEPSPALWSRLSKKLFYLNMLRNNVFYFVVAGVIISSSLIWALSDFSNTENNMVIVQQQQIEPEAENLIPANETGNAPSNNHNSKIIQSNSVVEKQEVTKSPVIPQTSNFTSGSKITPDAAVVENNENQTVVESKPVPVKVEKRGEVDPSTTEKHSSTVNPVNPNTTNGSSITEAIFVNSPVTEMNGSASTDERQRNDNQMLVAMLPIQYSPERTLSELPADDPFFTAGHQRKRLSVPLSVEIFGGCTGNLTSFKSTDVELQPFVDQMKNAFKPEFSPVLAGASFGLHLRNISFSGGFQYLSFTEEYNYGDILSNPQEKWDLEFNGARFDFEETGQFYRIDTTGGYYHYTYIADSIVHVWDSSYVYKTDTSQVDVFDSIRSVYYDSLKNQVVKTRFSVFEFPITMGFSIGGGKILWEARVGVIPRWIKGVSGEMFSLDDKYERVNPEDIIPYKQFSLAGMASLSASYFISEKMAIFGEAFCRRDVFSVINKDFSMSKKNTMFGLKAGLKIYF